MKELKEIFEAYAKAFKLDETLTNKVVFCILLMAGVLSVLKSILKIIEALIKKRNRKILKINLFPFYSKVDIHKATKFYIQTKYQNVAPSEDDEPGRKYIASAKNKLIPLFLNEVFPFGKDDNRFYLILADTGMGKTTFLINLYLAYKNKWKNPFAIPRYEIKLYPIWHSNTFPTISKIENKGNTILLLDAFDEDIEAVNNYTKRLNYILYETQEFRAVVITCRTQFFPSQQEEPHETGYFTGGEQGQYFFQKLYISVFDESDINRYLKKKFSIIWERIALKRARMIIEKSRNLVLRPMLLSNIKELASSYKLFKFSFQVYEEFIHLWLVREANKPRIIKNFSNKSEYVELLYSFSKSLAVDFYLNRTNRNGYFLPKGEDFSKGILKLSELDENFNKITSTEAKSNSLLNRNASGEYKFSHKSIFEYFLAANFFDDPDFLIQFNFHGMDAVKMFFNEMIIEKLELSDSEFKYRVLDKKWTSVNFVQLNMLDNIQVLKLRNINLLHPKLFFVFGGLKKLFLVNIKDLKKVYKIFENLHIQESATLKLLKSIEIKLENIKVENRIYELLDEIIVLLKDRTINLSNIITYKEIKNFQMFTLAKDIDLIVQHFDQIDLLEHIRFIDLKRRIHVLNSLDIENEGYKEMFKSLSGNYELAIAIADGLPNTKVYF